MRLCAIQDRGHNGNSFDGLIIIVEREFAVCNQLRMEHFVVLLWHAIDESVTDGCLSLPHVLASAILVREEDFSQVVSLLIISTRRET